MPQLSQTFTLLDYGVFGLYLVLTAAIGLWFVKGQRYLTATSLKVAQRGLWIKLGLVLPVTAVFYGSGLVLYAFYQVHGDPLAAGKITKAEE